MHMYMYVYMYIHMCISICSCIHNINDAYIHIFTYCSIQLTRWANRPRHVKRSVNWRVGQTNYNQETIIGMSKLEGRIL